MYVPRAMYSLRMSFWIVPLTAVQGMPRSSATTRYIASSVDAVALMVIEVDTRSSGMPSQQRVHVLDGVDRDAHPADLAGGARGIGVDTHLRRQVEGDGEPGLARRQQVAGIARWSPPRCRSRRTAASSTGGPRYIVGWMPRVNGNCPGSASAVS